LKDVLGEDGAIFFRAGDSGGMIAAVSRVVDDPVIARQNAVASAQTLSQRHDWKTAARRTLEAYARVVQQRRHGIQTGSDIGRTTPEGR
jgi:glycosyltransferase involved in cell wall biosynthesis